MRMKEPRRSWMPSRTTRPGTLAWRRRSPGSVGAQAERPRAAAELQRGVQALGEPREDRQVEVDDVPAREHVGVELAHAPGEGGEELLLRGEGARAVGALQPRGVSRSTSEAPQP